MMVGRLLSYWEGNFSGAMLNFGRVFSWWIFYQFQIFTSNLSDTSIPAAAEQRELLAAKSHRKPPEHTSKEDNLSATDKIQPDHLEVPSLHNTRRLKEDKWQQESSL